MDDKNKDLELIAKSDEDVTLVNLLRYDVIKAGQIIQHNSCNGDFAEYEKYVHKMRSMLDFFNIISHERYKELGEETKD